MSMKDRIPVAVLGATGAVGQRFVSLLENHPWFEVASVTGSDRTQGSVYGEAVRWVVPGDVPAKVAGMTVRSSDDPGDVALVFSALPSNVAREIEPLLAGRGYVVCSNASALRMQPDVPLLIPEINPDHLAVIDAQRKRAGYDGLIVTSPNCAVSAIIFPLAALHRAFGLSRVHAVTMQAISGAGYPGVPSIDIQDNVIPFIDGEEDKIENEPRKLLGAVGEGEIVPASFVVSAQAHRVPVSDGHLAALSVQLKRKASLGEVREALESFRATDEVAELPSAPARPLVLRGEPDRPQPRRDRDDQNGMAVAVGRLSPCAVLDYKMVALVHNTLRGAASGAILNAELLVSRGYLEGRRVFADVRAGD
jgi:aspartate-semialdehyde dehydrogenase